MRSSWYEERPEFTPDNTPLSGKIVWLLLYTHKHGEDQYIYSTEQNARLGAIRIIMEWIEDVEDPRAEEDILGFIGEGEFDKAVVRWGEYQETSGHPEFIYWEAHQIDDPFTQEAIDKIEEYF